MPQKNPENVNRFAN